MDKIICVTIFILVAINICFSQNSIDNSCVVSGAVLNPTNAVVPGIQISFHNYHINEKTTSDNEGQYKVTLPKGIYSISLDTKFNRIHFHRAKINIQCRSNVAVNLHWSPQQVSYGNESPEYKFVTLFNSKIDRLNVVIVFSDKSITNNLILYKNAVLTYNNYTIITNKITQNIKSGIFIAEGKVIIEDGKNITEAKKIVFKFSNLGFQILSKSNP